MDQDSDFIANDDEQASISTSPTAFGVENASKEKYWGKTYS